MLWRSRDDLNRYLSNLPDPERLGRAFAFSLFAKTAVFADDYRVSSDWQRLIVPTDHGGAILNLNDRATESIPISEAYFALFRMFYHQELLIDYEKSDIDSIGSTLNTELLTGALTWPYRYGRLLYDRYNDSYLTESVASIDSADLKELLMNTPQGVFQLGRIISGPLGFLESKERRFVPPGRKLNLWHCSDVGCSAPHTVTISPPSVPTVHVYQQLESRAGECLGSPALLGWPLYWLLREGGKRRGRKYNDLLVFLGNCFIGDELTAITLRALSGASSDVLRNALADSHKGKKWVEVSATELANKLSHEEQHQLCMVLSDQELINIIDECVMSATVRVPPKEVRRSIERPPSLYPNYDAGSELSSLGLRSINELPIINLASLIWKAYDECDNLNDLDWRIRNQPTISTTTALVDYIRQNSPSHAVQSLILSSEPVTRRIASDLCLSLEKAGSELLIPRILWKFGFDLPRYDDKYQRLRKRLDSFKETIINIGGINSEEDREAIRSAGVNLFVSLEEFLEELVVYNLWLLSSDHLLKTDFVYEHSEARRSVSKVLGEELRIGDTIFRWNSDGENTLGVTLCFLQETVDWANRVLSTDPTTALKSEEDLPHYITEAVRPFPFIHDALWADSDHQALIRLIDEFGSITKQIFQSNLAAIRNGLDHKRDESRFPTVNDMLAFEVKFRDAFDRADRLRFIPKSFWLISKAIDSFGQIEYVFSDYAGKKLVTRGPSSVMITEPNFGHPHLFAPGNLLGLPNSHLHFSIKDTSKYSEYWDGYPRRSKGSKHSGATSSDIAESAS